MGFVKQLTDMTLHREFGSEFGIVQLIYCSHAVNSGNKPEFERDLADILDRSHDYNAWHDITGALMTDSAMFAHVVEGPSVAVKELYAKIMRDKRHNRVLTLQHVLVHVRLFALWPVAFLRVDPMLYAGTLDARSTPAELRQASISIVNACRPLLLRTLT